MKKIKKLISVKARKKTKEITNDSQLNIKLGNEENFTNKMDNAIQNIRYKKDMIVLKTIENIINQLDNISNYIMTHSTSPECMVSQEFEVAELLGDENVLNTLYYSYKFDEFLRNNKLTILMNKSQTKMRFAYSCYEEKISGWYGFMGFTLMNFQFDF